MNGPNVGERRELMIVTREQQSDAKAAAMYWSRKTLRKGLKTLMGPFLPARADYDTYSLSIGPRAYVSPKDQTVGATTVTVRELNDKQRFTIPTGQLAFPHTVDVVSVPADVLAFTSIFAKTPAVIRRLLAIRLPMAWHRRTISSADFV